MIQSEDETIRWLKSMWDQYDPLGENGKINECIKAVRLRNILKEIAEENGDDKTVVPLVHKGKILTLRGLLQESEG